MPHKPLQTYDRKMKRFVTASESKAVTAEGISNNNNYWIRGELWYNCVHLFAVGIIFAKFEDKIIAFFKRFYAVLMPLSVLAVYPLYLFSRFVCNTYS
ncbi:MAG: hypothetical protein IKH94_06255 [Eubacterium sp.]|nr:hypothetical protein [Eubacterium sp.]